MILQALKRNQGHFWQFSFAQNTRNGCGPFKFLIAGDPKIFAMSDFSKKTPRSNSTKGSEVFEFNLG